MAPKSHVKLEGWPDSVGLEELAEMLEFQRIRCWDPRKNPGPEPRKEIQFEHLGYTITAGVVNALPAELPTTEPELSMGPPSGLCYAYVRTSPGNLETAEELLRACVREEWCGYNGFISPPEDDIQRSKRRRTSIPSSGSSQSANSDGFVLV